MERPKKNLSPYLYFASQRRPELKKECPDMSFFEYTQTIAAEWKLLSKSDKKPFNDIAAKDKERYEKEKREYVENGGKFQFPTVASPSEPSFWERFAESLEDSSDEKPDICNAKELIENKINDLGSENFSRMLCTFLDQENLTKEFLKNC